jgi:hypothetical protein
LSRLTTRSTAGQILTVRSSSGMAEAREASEAAMRPKQVAFLFMVVISIALVLLSKGDGGDDQSNDSTKDKPYIVLIFTVAKEKHSVHTPSSQPDRGSLNVKQLSSMIPLTHAAPAIPSKGSNSFSAHSC